MTKEQVYAAKEMFEKEIRNTARRLNIKVEEGVRTPQLVYLIMKKTSSELIIKRTMNHYAHYVQMNQRIDLEIWEEE
jgi:hypothetical protein